MSNFKLEFTLKQHTPLIHFQYDQSGATLRATELKPKLDKFLKRYAFDDDFEKYKHFLIGYDGKQSIPSDKDALDYKVRILAKFKKSDAKEIPRRGPLFFGNMGNNEDKYFVTAENEEIRIEIFSFYTELLNKIESHFAKFLMITNFGTRQSKGFGSFYLDSKDKHYVQPNAKYKFSIDSHDQRNLFYRIELFYKTLRSGINLKNRDGQTVFYFKSLMFLYAKSKGIQWEKKSIKEYYYASKLRAQQKEHDNTDILTYSSNTKKLMKDLLGLSTNESWRFPYHENISKEHANGEIERFKSPITFKPIKNSTGYDVYIFTEKIHPNFLDQLFNIKTNNRSGLSLKTPNLFNLDHFIDFVLNVDIKSHVNSDFHNRPEFRIIEEIYSNINSNLGDQNVH